MNWWIQPMIWWVFKFHVPLLNPAFVCYNEDTEWTWDDHLCSHSRKCHSAGWYCLVPGKKATCIKIQSPDVFWCFSCSFRAVRFRKFRHGSTCGLSKPGYFAQAEGCTSCFLLTGEGSLRSLAGSVPHEARRRGCQRRGVRLQQRRVVWREDPGWWDWNWGICLQRMWFLVVCVAIPPSVTQIGDFAFSRCSSFISVSIPNSVRRIGNHAFSECSSLMSLAIPDSVTTIENFAFCHCSSLTSVSIPNSVKRIGNGVFEHCSFLANVIIPYSITEIARSAFYGCRSLTILMIPSSVTDIGNGAFAECSSLTRLTLPNSLAQIGEAAFENCSSLTSVIIPHSVMQIGAGAFEGCSSLTSIAITNVQTCIGADAFEGCRGLPFFLKVKRRRISWTCDAVVQKKGFRLLRNTPDD